jgi:hypothetical protein
MRETVFLEQNKPLALIKFALSAHYFIANFFKKVFDA